MPDAKILSHMGCVLVFLAEATSHDTITGF
jgi:hypothetical protein